MFQRYSNPLILIDKMILTGRFNEFVGEIITMRNEEQEEKTLWEFYIHRVFDQSFRDWRNSLSTTTTEEVPTEEELIATVTGSMGILADFKLS